MPHPEGPQPCCVLPLSTSAKTCPTWSSQPPYTYPPGQAIATLDGRVPREFHTGDRLILSIDRGNRHRHTTYTGLELGGRPNGHLGSLISIFVLWTKAMLRAQGPQWTARAT